MKLFFQIIFKIFLILTILAGCATTEEIKETDSTVQFHGIKPTPKELAQEQWDRCNHFPSVVLVEITQTGELLVREKHTSGPPQDYVRCINAVEFEQVLAGKKDAARLLQRAYFTNKPPGGGWLYQSTYPPPAERVGIDEQITFFYLIKNPGRAFRIKIEWIGPDGKSARPYVRRHRIEDRLFPSFWSTATLPRQIRSPGLWTAKVYIEKLLAGEFEVELLPASGPDYGTRICTMEAPSDLKDDIKKKASGDGLNVSMYQTSRSGCDRCKRLLVERCKAASKSGTCDSISSFKCVNPFK
jgi:hypothetical protein